MADKKQGNWFGKHKVLTVIGVIILLIAFAGAASGNSSKSKTDSKNTNKQEAKKETKPEETKIGMAARDGKFEFTVKSIECNKPSVGTNEYLTKVAQGQYCLLNVTVKNIGNEAQSLYSGNQHLFNASNQKYSADDTATLYASPTGSGWFNDINPGNSVEGSIVFDLPKDQKPAVAELHDSSLSRGVKVSLQ